MFSLAVHSNQAAHLPPQAPCLVSAVTYHVGFQRMLAVMAGLGTCGRTFGSGGVSSVGAEWLHRKKTGERTKRGSCEQEERASGQEWTSEHCIGRTAQWPKTGAYSRQATQVFLSSKILATAHSFSLSRPYLRILQRRPKRCSDKHAWSTARRRCHCTLRLFHVPQSARSRRTSP